MKSWLWAQTGVPEWHSAEEMQLFSNAAHIVEGIILALVALIALAQARGYLQTGRWRFAWPGLLLFAGAFLLLYLLIPWHGLDMAVPQWQFIFGDPQQRQHFFIATAITLGGAAQLLHVRRQRAWLMPVFPVSMLAVAAAFLLHTQHGTSDAVERAVFIHRALGIVLFTAGILAFAAGSRPKVKWLRFAWPCALLLAAVLLFAYREPAGAYHGQESGPPHPQPVLKLLRSAGSHGALRPIKSSTVRTHHRRIP